MTVDGRAWTSPDGEQWTEWQPEALDGLVLKRIVNSAGTLYAFGQVGDDNCAANFELAVARSTDGSIWERLRPDLPDSFYPSGFGAIAGTLLVIDEANTWNSADGERWRRSGDLPFSFSWFEKVETIGLAVVALDGNGAGPAWFSDDAGSEWRHSEFLPTYGLNFLDSTAGTDLIVAVGEACCTLPNTDAGISLVSTDGRTWHESARFQDVPQAVVAIDGGYLAVGRNTWFSQDGIDWQVGPALPEFDRRSELAAVSADAGVLVINGDFAWFARGDALGAAGWAESPREAELPEVGTRYPVDLFLHCGWQPILFGLRTWVPDPPFEDNINPPPGYGDEDRGWLNQLGENELQYESRRGQIVNHVPSQGQGSDGPCA